MNGEPNLNFPGKFFPLLESDRLLLRELRGWDAQGMLDLYSNVEVTKFSEMPTLTTLAQAERVLEQFRNEFWQDTGARWAITQKGATQLIGTISAVWQPQNFSALLGYDLLEKFRNQGLATEAARLVINHCFENTRTNRISATTTLDNDASIRILDKLGFKEEGVLREWGFWKGKFVDLRCFSLLRRDRTA